MAELVALPFWVTLVLVLLCGLVVLAIDSSWAVLLLVALVFHGLHGINTRNTAVELAQMLGPGPTAVEACGVVQGEPRPVKKGWQFPVELRWLKHNNQDYRCRAAVLVDSKGGEPTRGDTVWFVGTASGIEPPRNPGEFDLRAFLLQQGIQTRITVRYAGDATILERSGPLGGLAGRAKAWIVRTIQLDLERDPEIAALIASMVVGASNQTPHEMLALFQKTGTVHLFAVSGLNVAMFAVMAWMILKPTGIGKGRAVPVLAFSLLFYAVLTGLSASALRAAVTGTLLLVGFSLDRKPLPLNTLAAAAFLLLLWDTRQLFQPGFQLSFVVVLAILLWATPIQGFLRRKLGPDPLIPERLRSRGRKWLQFLTVRAASLAGVSVAAWLGALPLTLFYFHMVSPIAVLTNLLVVPLAFVVLALAMLSLGAGLVAPLVSTIFNNANWAVAQCVIGIVQCSAALPGSCFYVGFPDLSGPLGEVIVFDLGTGGAVFINLPGGKWLLDCGRSGDFERIIAPALHQRGVMRLSGLLLSHGDAGHLGGALAAIREFEPAQICVSRLQDRSRSRRALESELSKAGIPKTSLTIGDSIGPFRVLYPPGDIQVRNADDQALIFQLQCGATRILFFSDNGFIAEQWLLENATDLECDILVKGEREDPVELLARANPRLVISAADRFTRKTEPERDGFWRQDQCGAVLVKTYRQRVEVRSFVDKRVYTFINRAR